MIAAIRPDPPESHLAQAQFFKTTVAIRRDVHQSLLGRARFALIPMAVERDARPNRSEPGRFAKRISVSWGCSIPSRSVDERRCVTLATVVGELTTPTEQLSSDHFWVGQPFSAKGLRHRSGRIQMLPI